jgi:hypothetical protein
MFWKRIFSGGLPDPGKAMRDEHSAWLTRAFATKQPVPRIPIRAVDKGGFSKVMELPSGPGLAARWWQLALERIKD